MSFVIEGVRLDGISQNVLQKELYLFMIWIIDFLFFYFNITKSLIYWKEVKRKMQGTKKLTRLSVTDLLEAKEVAADNDGEESGGSCSNSGNGCTGSCNHSSK